MVLRDNPKVGFVPLNQAGKHPIQLVLVVDDHGHPISVNRQVVPGRDVTAWLYQRGNTRVGAPEYDQYFVFGVEGAPLIVRLGEVTVQGEFTGIVRHHFEKQVGGDGALAIPVDQGGKIVRLHEGADLH